MVENCEGPPTGYDWKQFLARVRLVRLTRLERSPCQRYRGVPYERPHTTHAHNPWRHAVPVKALAKPHGEDAGLIQPPLHLT